MTLGLGCPGADHRGAAFSPASLHRRFGRYPFFCSPAAEVFFFLFAPLFFFTSFRGKSNGNFG